MAAEDLVHSIVVSRDGGVDGSGWGIWKGVVGRDDRRYVPPPPPRAS